MVVVSRLVSGGCRGVGYIGGQGVGCYAGV